MAAEHIMTAGVPKKIPEEIIITIPANVPDVVKRVIYGKVQSALKRNTRVMYQDTNETKIALDLVSQMEKATSLLLSRVGMHPDDVVPFVRRYFETLTEMGDMTKAACEKAGIEYKDPRGLRMARGEDVSRKTEKADAKEPRGKEPKAKKQEDSKDKSGEAAPESEAGAPELKAAMAG